MPDFGFVGASYEAPSIYQDAQECINFYPEQDPTKSPGERGIVALYPTPGLVQKLQLAVGEVRGMRALSGNQYLVVVSGSKVYSVNTAFMATEIGTLSTNSGSVQITDNVTTNNGLTAYIVDGVNRYTWVASTNTFATLPSTDGLWSGATACDTVDNYIAYNEPGTQNWAVTDLGLAVSTTGNYGSKDGSPDTLISLIIDHRQVYLLGEVTTEVWVDVGNTIEGITAFPFQRVAGTTSQHGLAAAYSVARFGESFMFVSRDTRGQSIIGSMQGYQFKRLSTHAVEQSLVGVDVSDAIAYTYQVEGHEFYVATFPQADLT
ncbi:packaged DNA stabilization protein, partial [Methanobrevibacter gottschalkii]|uniref:packaged DNA stabilization protein n=1 Tax=Methanobrevibacter gottschalkii TaxID=190974 RepID=UPI0038D1B0D5